MNHHLTSTHYRLSAGLCWIGAVVLISTGFGSFVNSAEQEKNLVDRFEAKVFETSDTIALPYRILSPPEIEPGQDYPLVLFLHGAGERGTDNTKQLVHVAQELATAEMTDRFPCFVVAPQCPEGERWVEVDWGLLAHEMPAQPSNPLKATLKLLEQLKRDLPIDADRVYICGLSMGGFGTWDAIQRHPELFAAAVPICGGGDPAYAEQIKTMPIWAFHGAADGAVKVQRSREMVKALQAIGGHVIYTEYPGVGHNSWAMTAENRLVWDWLFAHQRPGAQ